MKPKSKDLMRLATTARDMKEQAGRVAYNVLNRRVTHTVKGLTRLINYMVILRKNLQDADVFGKEFEHAIYQCQKGPTEVRFEKGFVFIQGSFHVDMLREFFVVNEPPGMITLTVEGPKNGEG